MKKYQVIKIFLILLIVTFSLFSSEINKALVSANKNTISNHETINQQVKKNKYKGNFIIQLKDNISNEEKLNYLKRSNFEEVTIDDSFSTNTVKTKNIANKIDYRYVEKVEEDHSLGIQTKEINDPAYNEQWYLKGIEYISAIESENSEPTVVAVIDSGICKNHPDLSGKILEGWNFVGNNNNTEDEIGHGCAISGLIAANTNNNKGIAGVSLNTKILPLKIIDRDGIGSYSALVNAIEYAIEMNVDIINISLGGYADSKILHDSVVKATSRGIKIVASAGNTGSTEILYPAKFSEVISVGSVENDYTISSSSSSSSNIKLWSFGSNLLSTTINGELDMFSGTSMSTAVVSAFLSEGGEYKEGGIINFATTALKPVSLSELVQYYEPVSGLEISVPNGLNIEGFENRNPDSFIINWQKVIKVASGEAMAISVWNRNSSDEINEVKTSIQKQDGCADPGEEEICLRNFPHKVGANSGYAKYITRGNSLVRVIYSFDKLIGLNIFKMLAQNLKLKKEVVFDLSNFQIFDTMVQDRIYPQGATTCGGFSDSNNPYDCCDSNVEGQNDANCTWYAAYKRPDLKGTITLWPEGLFSQAVQAGFPTSPNQPEVGALIVWKLHVAYVESYTSTSVTWSEQNCYSSNNPYNAAVMRNSHTPSYGAGDFLGYILFKGGGNDCNGQDPIKSDWNVTTSLTCNPQGSLTILPYSTLTPAINDTIIIAPN